MSQRAIAPLSELIPGYPAIAPQTMSDLLATDYGFLTHLEATEDEISLVKEFRRELLETIRSRETVALTSPEVALQELSNRHIRPLARRWLTIALDKDCKRRLVPKPSEPGVMVYASHISERVPTARELFSKIPLPEGGRYLVIFGQSPDIISNEPIADALSRLMASAPIADVLFWHLVKGVPPTLFSLRKGLGDRSGQPVEFPDPVALARARTKATRSASTPNPTQDESPDQPRRT